MPILRCPKCGQSYDVPGAVAVRLPNSIATCSCGEWLAGNKAALLARMMHPGDIREVDLAPYRIATEEASPQAGVEDLPPARPRSVRIVTRANGQPIDVVFTIHLHPLWIGRYGCHLELDDADLSIRHCSILVQGDSLVVRDADSHTGTFLDGQEIDRAEITAGTHLLRVGSVLMTVEPTGEEGVQVRALSLPDPTLEDSLITRAIRARSGADDAARRAVLVCIGGTLNGQEFEIPSTGLVVGREGHVRIGDEFLSRRHFEVKPDEDGSVRVRDLGSRNGTFLNTLPAQNTKVRSGDEIKAGVNRFRIEMR